MASPGRSPRTCSHASRNRSPLGGLSPPCCRLHNCCGGDEIHTGWFHLGRLELSAYLNLSLSPWAAALPAARPALVKRAKGGIELLGHTSRTTCLRRGNSGEHWLSNSPLRALLNLRWCSTKATSKVAKLSCGSWQRRLGDGWMTGAGRVRKVEGCACWCRIALGRLPRGLAGYPHGIEDVWESLRGPW